LFFFTYLLVLSLRNAKEMHNITNFPHKSCYERFFGLLSATFGQNLPFSDHQITGQGIFLGPVFSYLAENSVIRQQMPAK
jgi:hypothetical protein